MYLRDTNFDTLGDLMEKVSDRRLYARANSVDIRVLLEDGTENEDPVEGEFEGTNRRGTIVVGKKEIPATKRGLAHLAAFYDVPTKFLERVQPDEQQFILDHRIQRSTPKPVVIRYDDLGIAEVYNAEQTRVTQEQMIEGLLDVLPEESMVTDWFDERPEWWGSVVAPEGYTRYIGGDKPSGKAKVGDLTHGGVRFGRNVRDNLAPWVQTYMFRLVCTNGMEIPDYGLKVDARGMEADEIVMAFKGEAKRALDTVDKKIAAFYELREHKVGDDRTGLLRRMGQEGQLPDRTVGRLEDTLADTLLRDQVDDATLFDLINHITNMANQPGMRSSSIRSLQQAGGVHIQGHEHGRCNACHNLLN